jgi:DNA polymerase-3 subunit delta'
LKTLEEPGGDLLLILTTSQRHALRPTILSRCQQIQFDPLGEEEILAGLRSLHDLPLEQMLVAAKLANGSFTRALDLADEETMADRGRIVEFLRAAWSRDAEAIMKHAQHFQDLNDRQAAVDFLTGIQWWFRDVSAIQEGYGDKIVNVDLQKPLHDFSDHFRSVDAGAAIKILEESIEFTQKNSQIVLVLIHVAQEIHHCLSS